MPLAVMLWSTVARADNGTPSTSPPDDQKAAGTPPPAASSAPATTPTTGAAATTPPSTNPSETPAAAAPSQPPTPPNASSPASDNTKAPSTPLSFIEREPPTAFPTDPIRGLEGGSLWSTFHGQQFPYYPKTGIGVSGYVWLDSGYEKINRGAPPASMDPSLSYWLQQGRMVLRVTPTWSDGKYFAQGQAELVGAKDQTQAQPFSADADDVWVKAGQWKLWDVQLGRFEAWEIYHFGMGLDLYTLERNGATDSVYSAPGIYGVTYAFYRPNGLGNAAIHLYPTKNLRFELLGQYGNDTGANGLAARPTAVLDLGWFKLKAGGEYLKTTPQQDGTQGSQTEQGFGGSAQFVIDPYVEFGGNAAYGWVRQISVSGQLNPTGSFDTYSAGGFANVRLMPDLLLGGGFNYTYLVDEHFDQSLNRNEKFDHTQAFAAIQYRVKSANLFVKLVGAHALARFAPTFMSPIYNDEMWSARLRVQYLF
jgi:hypothetical protein